jgi:hypothetical protein
MTAVPIAVARALPGDRLRYFGVLAALLLWLAYTRVFFLLQAAHVTAPPCPFYYFTGHPCPFCGGTRSFAYMWQGDLTDSVRLYPLGPALFASTFVAAAGLAVGAVSRRTWTPHFTAAQWRALAIGAVSAIVLSWALKVFVLGN